MYDDMEEVLQKFGISEFKAKVVPRKYCFEQKGIPPGEHEWHKLVYSFASQFRPVYLTPISKLHNFANLTIVKALFLTFEPLICRTGYPNEHPEPNVQ